MEEENPIESGVYDYNIMCVCICSRGYLDTSVLSVPVSVS